MATSELRPVSIPIKQHIHICPDALNASDDAKLKHNHHGQANRTSNNVLPIDLDYINQYYDQYNLDTKARDALVDDRTLG